MLSFQPVAHDETEESTQKVEARDLPKFKLLELEPEGERRLKTRYKQRSDPRTGLPY